MPGGGAEARSGLMATLRVLRHEMLTAPDLDDLLDRLHVAFRELG
jgi:Zn-dependent M32 family carboxypeptidase